MMEGNNDIFLAGSDALVHLAVTVYKRYFTAFVWGPIHLVPWKHMYAFRLIVSVTGLFQKILLNTIGHLCLTI